MLLNVTNKLTFKRGLSLNVCHVSTLQIVNLKGYILLYYQQDQTLIELVMIYSLKSHELEENDLSRRSIGSSLIADCNNRYYSKYCLFHLRSCFYFYIPLVYNFLCLVSVYIIWVYAFLIG